MARVDPARTALVASFWVGAVVLRALHDLPVSDFMTITVSLVTFILGGGVRGPRRSDLA